MSLLETLQKRQAIDEPEILVGTLGSPYQFKTENRQPKKIEEWDYRAMWSFLRLQCGRSIDKEIRQFIEREGRRQYSLEYVQLSREQRSELLDAFYEGIVATRKMSRKVQFIMHGSRVRAVASLKHILLPPMDVYKLAHKIMQKKYPNYEGAVQEGMTGLTYTVEELAGFNVGLQLYGGDIYTRRAITLSSWLRVLSCFNPLSWMGYGGGFTRFNGDSRVTERMLRIKKASDLKPRLQAAIEAQLEKTGKLKDIAEQGKKTKVTKSEAEIVMAAFGLSFNLGASTVDQIIERLKKEDRTKWGMAMASSWVAQHGEIKHRENPRNRTVQDLSTIAAAALSIRNVKHAKEKSLAWLEAHIHKGKSQTMDDLAKKIKLWEQKKK